VAHPVALDDRDGADRRVTDNRSASDELDRPRIGKRRQMPENAERAEVDDGEGLAAADLDFAELERIRAELPSLANRRPEAYRWPQLAEASA